MRNRRRKVGECAYCGETRPLTDDHVPPRNLFAPPRPPDLITVPSCNQCHDPMSKDDEYFRLALANRADVAEHPDAVGVWPAMMRSLQRPEAPGLKRSFLGEVRKVGAYTPAGIYLGERLAYYPDPIRLNRVAGRVVRGLFYHHTGRALPKAYKAVAYLLEAVDPTSEALAVLRGIEKMTSSQELRIIGQNAFAYRYLFDGGDSAVSAWWLLFYGRIVFVGATVPI